MRNIRNVSTQKKNYTPLLSQWSHSYESGPIMAIMKDSKIEKVYTYKVYKVSNT